MKNKYKHDCGKCEFLGSFENADLYYCSNRIPDLICRYSDKPSDYQSYNLKTFESTYYLQSVELKEAYKLAVEKGLIKNPINFDINSLGLAEIEYYGCFFKTGVPVSFSSIRNTESSRNHNIDQRLYQQNIEPAGIYRIFDERPNDDPLPGWEKRAISFKNPLVLNFNMIDEILYDDNNWKSRLYHFSGEKTGAELSQYIKKTLGYDAIITVNGDAVLEIVDLINGFIL